MTGTVEARVRCQIYHCAQEVSYCLDMVRLFGGRPLCQTCYEDGDLLVSWADLPPVKLKDLRA